MISWCGNFEERHSFRIVLGESPETMRKLCLSAKFPPQEIRWNYGIFRSETDFFKRKLFLRKSFLKRFFYKYFKVIHVYLNKTDKVWECYSCLKSMVKFNLYVGFFHNIFLLYMFYLNDSIGIWNWCNQV